MSTPRALANQALYHARILASSWRSELAREQIPATVLAGAFYAAAKNHLHNAYGWFLIEITAPAELPGNPPTGVDALPAIDVGRAAPGELHELRQLEEGGWLAAMLLDEGDSKPAKAQQSLAISVSDTPHPDEIDTWIEQLQQIFERMADSLDEY